ncbi:hypothetical protein [Lapillicoccus jejuensis]|uniref:hypothetical protein n=1 Tax=Lapillicoccus jejuensis TaxID=402171 RepID=UPI001152947E|nr:hypothetical protein [Lapillicoccus jejuensis]
MTDPTAPVDEPVPAPEATQPTDPTRTPEPPEPPESPEPTQPPEQPEQPEPGSPPAGRGRFVVAALLAVGVLAAAGGVAAGVQAQRLRSTDAARNLALVDADRTDEVVSQVDAALAAVFTYDYRTPATTSQAATRLLVGDASAQYRTLFDTLQKKAAGQQLTMTATVQLAGVETLGEDHARLLVFLDQTSTRASDGTRATSAAQLAVGAVRQGSTWRIDEIRPQ